ncbi:MAG: hypothetical protein CV087_06065 [Candidatus Brocadia sp. WS118]|nr:MAG: hypothetical protein CV087_06065 [Candidatus Brocadia sp. WS118]
MTEYNYTSFAQIYSAGIVATLLIAGLCFFFFLRRPFLINRARGVFVFSLVFYSVYILIFQVLKLYTFKYYSDFAVWLELVSRIIDGHGIISTLHQTSLGFGDTRNYLALHFVPLIYIIALPLYVMKNYSIYLIVLQTVIMVSSIIPIYLFARDTFREKNAGYLFASSFLFFPTIQYINLYDFEFLRMSIPLLLFSFYFLYKRRYRIYYLFLMLALLVREEIGLTTFILGVYIFFIMKEKKHGIMTSGISLFYFLMVTKGLMPYFAGNSSSLHYHVASGNFSYLGNSPSQILLYIISHPIAIVSNLLDKIKIANLLMYVVPLVFLPFFSPSVFFIATGNLLLNFLSASISHYSYILYYLSPSIPFFFLSAIQGAKNVSERYVPLLKGRHILLNRLDDKRVAYALVSCIFIACVVSNIFFGPSPLSIQFWNKNYLLAPYKTHNFHYSQYLPTGHHGKAIQFFPLIPDDATVSAEHFFLPYLYKKKALMQFPIFEGADYVLIDKTHPVKFGTIGVDPIEARKNPQQYYDMVEKDTKNWELVKEEDGIFLFKKRGWN